MTYTKGESLGDYECGCSVHKDSNGFYIIDWCNKHKAADEMYEALKFTLNALELMTTNEFQHGGDRLARQKITEALASAF